jgi:hypothetical protein
LLTCNNTGLPATLIRHTGHQDECPATLSGISAVSLQVSSISISGLFTR